jgi:pSer/pThr/pTyr-binding forkhead associated (FHA) protein
MAGESLRVVSGNAAGTEIALGQVLLIGSGVSGPGSLGGDGSLAAEHARVMRGLDGRVTVEDLGSPGGTIVNDKQISGAVPVRAGDTIRVGSSTLQVIDQVGRAPEATSFRQVEAALPTPPPEQAEAPRTDSAPATGLLPQSLNVIAGPAAGTEIKLGGQLLIGRATTGVGRLGDDPELSREHARISRGPEGLAIEDLGSTNGTFVNEQRVSGRRLLQAGDRIRLGETTLEVAAGDAAAVGAPAQAPLPVSPPTAPQRAPAASGSNPAVLIAIVVVALVVLVAILFAAGVI